ncbi:sensor histidine kinase [Nocardia yunnanensis]|uniref:sensor histidine kinase n=1 Tax=Nocardia yunnanensis TaxID=2382165 RepID=UPI0013C3EBE2|nr:histidine kinase [Nocardia yunnanensis]
MSGTRRVGRVILDVLLAVIFGVTALDEVHTSSMGLLPGAAGPPVAITVAVVLLVRRVRPLAVLAVAVLGFVLVGAAGPVVLGIFTVADRYGNRRPTWLSVAGSLLILAVPWGASTYPALFFGRTAIMAVVLSVPLLLGLWTSQRRETVAALRDRAEQAECERDLRAAAAVEAERLRIAGELHDIVAHRISQITVLAGALEVSADGKPAEIAATIRTTGSRALTEMRELLGILRTSEAGAPRDDTGPVPLRPAPDLSAIAELVEVAVAAGQQVELTAPAVLPPVAGPVGRAAYRVVQEALTNAAKHAAGAEVRVDIAALGDRLDVDVRNGRGDPTALAAAGSGFGLVGMRKRVELAGGALHSGPLPGGGYRVHASFPWQEGS